MSNLEVIALNIYPIRDCGPAKVEEIDMHGIAPSYAIKDANGYKVSPYDNPSLAKINVLAQDGTYYAWNRQSDDGVRFDADGEGYGEVEEASEWFSGVLGKTVKLVRVSHWKLPVLAVTQGTLDYTPAVMRPNIVIDGTGSPYEEDEWRTLRIGRAKYGSYGVAEDDHMGALLVPVADKSTVRKVSLGDVVKVTESRHSK